MSRSNPTPDWQVIPVKVFGLALIVAIIGGACLSDWGNQPATLESEGQAMIFVIFIIIGFVMILYEPDL